MSPSSWANPEQETFLLEFFDDFVQCQAKRDYRDFWPPFFERWFAKFPERAVVFPEIPDDTVLSKEQKTVLEAAVESRMDQLRNKLRNNWGVKRKARVAKDTDAKATTALIADLIRSKETRRRKPQKIEAYLNLYYEDKIRPTIEGALEVGKSDALAAAVSAGSKGEKLPPKLVTIMNRMREMFRSESPEVVAKVEERWKEMVAEKENKDEWNTRDKQYYIDRIAPTVAQFLTGFKELTGWSFSVLMGGPTLEDGGKIEACSLHIGVTELGHTFDQAYPEFNNSMMRPYREFLDRVTASATAKENLEAIQMSPKESVVEAEVEIEPRPSTSTHVATDVIASGAGSGSPTLAIPALRLTSGVEEFAVPPISPDVSSLVSWSGLEDFSGLPPIQSLDAVPDNFTYNFNPAAMEPLDNFLAKYGSGPLPQPPTASSVTAPPSASSSGGNHVTTFQRIVAAASAEVASSVWAQVDQSMIPQARPLAAVVPPSTVQTHTVVPMMTPTSSSPQTLANESTTTSAEVALSVPSTSQQADQPLIPQARPLAAITMSSTVQTQTVIPLTTPTSSSPQTLANKSAASSTEVALVPSTLRARAVQSQPADVALSVPSALQAQVDQPTMPHANFLPAATIPSATEAQTVISMTTQSASSPQNLAAESAATNIILHENPTPQINSQPAPCIMQTSKPQNARDTTSMAQEVSSVVLTQPVAPGVPHLPAPGSQTQSTGHESTPMTSSTALAQENTGTTTITPLEPGGKQKRARQPSKRNQVADSIGTQSGATKKRTAASGSTVPATSKKRKTT